MTILHVRGTYARAILLQLSKQPGMHDLDPRLPGTARTRTRVTALLAWMRGEFGDLPCNGKPGEGARFNCMATTRPMPGATPYNTFGNNNHVYNYPSWGVGVTAIAETLLNGNYPGILAELLKGASPIDICKAIASSPWGTGNNVLEALPTVEANRLAEWKRPVG